VIVRLQLIRASLYGMFRSAPPADTMERTTMNTSLLDHVEYELQQIRKLVYVAQCALTCEESDYVADDVAHVLDEVVSSRVSNLLDEIKERRARPSGPPKLRLVPK
jgi:hypothetical protein